MCIPENFPTLFDFKLTYNTNILINSQEGSQDFRPSPGSYLCPSHIKIRLPGNVLVWGTRIF